LELKKTQKELVVAGSLVHRRAVNSPSLNTLTGILTRLILILDGWGEKVKGGFDDYDEIFGEL
jgi:hypothetical protein